MKSFRKRLERHKTILKKRLKEKPVKEQKPRNLLSIPTKFRQKLRQVLLLARAGQQMEAVSSAIERLDKGNYGKCLECGKEIEPKRLEAMPTVTHCWHCQHDKS